MKQTHGDKTREKILDTGLKLWPEISVSGVAKAAGLTHPAVLYHFPDGLKESIIDHAIETDNSRVIVQLIAVEHPAMESFDAIERQRHFDAI